MPLPYGPSVPESPLLVLEGYQIAYGFDPRGTPGIVEEHAARFRIQPTPTIASVLRSLRSATSERRTNNATTIAAATIRAAPPT